MPRSALPVAILAAAALMFGCSEPTVPDQTLSSRASPIVVIDGKLIRVFNVQLRSVEDPNIIDDPNIRPHGNLQLKLYENADGTFSLAWRAQVVNPAGEAFTGFSLTQVGIDRPAFLAAFGEVEGSPGNGPVFDVYDHSQLEDELAVDLVVQDPEGAGTEPDGPDYDLGDFVIVLFSVERPDGALSGRL